MRWSERTTWTVHAGPVLMMRTHDPAAADALFERLRLQGDALELMVVNRPHDPAKEHRVCRWRPAA